MPLGAPTGPGNIFAGGPVQPAAQAQGPAGQQLQPGMLMPFATAASGQSAQQSGQQGQSQGQGQQPILNDALSYLDQVKVQFADHPDVYNRFLDIMKDFKSGAIDTPGVIGRVSTLFAGNPELIQGFNTFLPPGYRIECGADNDPNAIRVTTPMGSSIQPMPRPQRLHGDPEGPPDNLRPANGTSTPQPGQFAPRVYSPSGRTVGAAESSQPQPLASIEAARQQEQQQARHQQEQRGVNSLQSAVSAATGGASLRAGVSPRTTPLPGQQDPSTIAEAQSGQQGIEKRGPVEFNHAISYVNKIKNRFSSQPDIYKQFLEILQTYQRESKPIQDVYSQVTQLFMTAPDLLDDFKQFLPESAAQAKAAEAARRQAEETVMLSNVRGEAGGPYASPVMSRETQMGTPNHGRSNLPPVGNFAPTPISKEGKRKRGDRQGTVGSAGDGTTAPVAGKGGYGAQQGKRLKQTHQPSAKGPSDAPPTSPTIVPRLPEPLPPTTTSAATHEELSFFDRAKKAIGNKNTMNEFLKLCNLFSQDFIDRSILVYRARAFIGSNAELMKWFQEFVGYDEKDIIFENKAREPAVPGGRISLSNCRGLGPSYRLLPKRERVKPCSGRDELCNSVLNDEWASHPTWASEDSGFIAHRKNVHEEGLHRIEEERHDYDYNIEACNRTIQLLEPIATQLRRMSNEEAVAFRLPPGLGGQSETIYQRVVMKLYGREKGHDVITQLHATPYQVIPVLINRLKERLETWKMAQREWEKVWREQTQKMFWRSLDHQAANLKNNDRRQFQTKALQADMQIRFEEMKAGDGKPLKPGGSEITFNRGKPQVELQMTDEDVVVDATYLILVHIKEQESTDSPRLRPWIVEFMPMLLGIDAERFIKKLNDKMGANSPAGYSGINEEFASGAEDSAGEKRGRKNGKTTLLRQAVDRGPKGKMGRKDREDSNASASRASTPDIASNAGDDATADGMVVDSIATPVGEPTMDSKQAADEATQRWLNHPVSENALGAKNVDPNELQERKVYRLWANSPIYCFVRMFMHLYERLHRLKNSEAECREIVRNANKPKPAKELGIMDKLPSDYFADTSPSANYYNQMLSKFVSVLEGEIDFLNDGVEDCLRRFYLQSGYPLYAFEKMVQSLARFGLQIVNQEGGNKERSWEVYNLWKKDRVKPETSAVQSTDYRKAAEKLVANGDTYRVEWDDQSKSVKIYLVKKDDEFYTDGTPSARDLEDRWRYYIASYTSLEDTEGVDKKYTTPVLLMRNVHALGATTRFDKFLQLGAPFGDPSLEAQAVLDGTQQTTSQDAASEARVKDRLLSRFLTANNDERLILRIAVNNYHPIFQPGTAEGFFEDMRQRQGGEHGVQEAEGMQYYRAEAMMDGFLMNNPGMKGLSKEEVEKRNEEFAALAEGRELSAVAAGDHDGEEMDVDE
ncbi:Transcriptional regulatory protein sin3 [Vermiconidia calcicola]|uniref:Transcriptional regulatory protein sin3 n=1 Tax=Vermiconidia calcicola TaxID=1690605 RepID=A0ACC3NLL5_9PEZI|nr:Transcriptional regulatory protein sin3 [Vermiconidia calcicola]